MHLVYIELLSIFVSEIMEQVKLELLNSQMVWPNSLTDKLMKSASFQNSPTMVWVRTWQQEKRQYKWL